MNSKICPTCQQEKELTEFYNKLNKDGSIYYWRRCKDCVRKGSSKWKVDNPDKHQKHRETFEAKPERIEYLKENGVRQRESGYSLEWQRKNPDKCSVYAKQHRIHDITETEWKECLSVFNNTCAYCGLPVEKHIVKRNGKNIIMKLHKDHVDHDGSNDLRNAVPSCRSCNDSKHQSDLEEWYRKQEFFCEEKLNKIIWWITEGYKNYIEEKPPYRIIKKQNEDKKTFHWELWSVDNQRNMIECIKTSDKKKDLI